MKLIEITDLSDERIRPFAALTEAQLRNKLHPEDSLFIAESPKVIAVALNQGYIPVAMLCEQRHIIGDAAALIERCPEEMPVYTGTRQILSALTGYTLTRGVLCAMRRPQPPTVEQICRDASRVAVIQAVSDTTNIGAIFRSAAALGVDAVLLTPDSCDPLNRRSIRVSMGSVFLVPWTWTDPSLAELKDLGFKTAALALTDKSRPITDPEVCALPRLAMIFGTEGDGLPREAIAAADYTLRIPMHHDVDSLNVAAAAAVTFWQLRRLE